MWLFEVTDVVCAGFKVSFVRPGEPVVLMGYDEEFGGPQILPFGRSLMKFLEHPDDQGENFRLYFGLLDEKTSGLKLTAQAKEEADKDDRALVLIDGCSDPDVGSTELMDAHGRQRPEHITYAKGDGCKRELYLFKPGDGLYINWSGPGLPKPHRFTVWWDAEAKQLRERPWRPRPRRWRERTERSEEQPRLRLVASP